ncbi:class I SAM-dependent methyltransferase [Bradyrhizobium hipponense]|uniref:Class I SAM-dependent methyltransferase n=1 Tax=Bradyrhizobium hipponense TaxID=2605638 RepID=A0A5S4YX98_9BRAD|nr:class I SAM-dependent methyltransferase [Bradyrhizobium hipponense]
MASIHETRRQVYEDKPDDYFKSVRLDIIADLPAGHKLSLLEIGCGYGATLAEAKRQGKAARIAGVEIDPKAAAQARRTVDEIIVGDVELIELPFAPYSFDVLILSAVLEHLVDPWQTLKRLHPLLKIGGLIYASSPSVAHITVLRMLLRNRWDYAERGRLDRTHLRWFTPETYCEMVERAGFKVHWVRPVEKLTGKQAVADLLTLRRFSHLFTSQIFLKAERMA